MPAYFEYVDAANLVHVLHFDCTLEEKHDNTSVITEHPVETGYKVTDHTRAEQPKLSLQAMVVNHPIQTKQELEKTSAKLHGAHEGAISELEVPYDIIKNNLVPGGKKLDVAVAEPKIPLNPAGALVSAFEGLLAGAKDYNASVYGDIQVARRQQKALVLRFTEAFNAPAETYDLLLRLKDEGTLLTVVTPYRIYDKMLIEKVFYNRNRESGDSITFNIDLKRIRTVNTLKVSAPDPSTVRGMPIQNKGNQNGQSGESLIDKMLADARRKADRIEESFNIKAKKL